MDNFKTSLLTLQQELLTEDVNEGWKEYAAALGLSAAALGYNQYHNKDKVVPPTPAQQSSSQVAKQQTPSQFANQQLQKKAQPTIKKGVVKEKNIPLFQILEKEAIKAGIKGKELAQLLAQAHHETEGFSRLKERGNSRYFRMYDITKNPVKAKDLGNTKPGDGALYKGRGYLQTTGKANYRKAGEALGLPLAEKPHLLEDPHVAAKATIYYWFTRVRPSIQNFDNVDKVTSKINSGLKGLDERKKLYQYYRDHYI